MSTELPDVWLRFVESAPIEDESDRAIWVVLDDGRYWNNGSPVREGADADNGVAFVATCAQDTIVEVLRRLGLSVLATIACWMSQQAQRDGCAPPGTTYKWAI